MLTLSGVKILSSVFHAQFLIVKTNQIGYGTWVLLIKIVPTLLFIKFF